MVGIKVGGTNCGLGVGSTVTVAVGLGLGVKVAGTVEVGDGAGDGVAITDGPHAMNDKPITRQIITRKRFFILTHSLGIMLDGLMPTI